MRRLRTTLAVLFALAFVLLTPLALASAWAASQVDDTDAYVDNVAGIIDEPDVRDDVAALLESELVAGLGTDFPQAGEVAAGAVDEVLDSDEFAESWRDANREAHGQIVDILRGDADTGGEVVINLDGLYDAAADVLSAEGIRLDDNAGELQFRTAAPEQLEDAQSGYQSLVGAGVWLPILTVVLLVAAIATAPGRARWAVTTLAGFGAALMSGLLLAGSSVGTGVFADQVGADERALASAVVDALLSSLRRWAWIVIIVGLAAVVVSMVALAVTQRRPQRRPGPPSTSMQSSPPHSMAYPPPGSMSPTPAQQHPQGPPPNLRS